MRRRVGIVIRRGGRRDAQNTGAGRAATCPYGSAEGRDMSMPILLDVAHADLQAWALQREGGGC